MSTEQKIRQLAADYANRLRVSIDERVEEMKGDERSHFLIYRVLRIANEEGHLIDLYQNKGRFLYKYAGSFLEEAAKLCFKETFPESGAIRISNTQGSRPKTFEIDCLVGSEAIEIKWRDATTDGDHITKEHTRLRVIAEAGYTPVRVMFYYPIRTQAIRIQQALKTLYVGMKGQFYAGEDAWVYVHQRTGVDLKGILEKVAAENTHWL